MRCVYVRACACVHSAVAMLKMDIVVKCFFDFVSTVDTTKNKVAQSDGDAGADVDAAAATAGASRATNVGRIFPTLHTLRSPLPLCQPAYCPTVSLLCTCGCGDRPSDTVGGGGVVSLLLLLGVGQCFLFRLPYAYFNFCFSLRAHAPRAPNFHVTPFP